MLTDRGDDMIPRAKEPVDGRVQCLGRIGCKGDAGRAFGVEEPGQRFPGLVDDTGGVQGGRMGSTARVGPLVCRASSIACPTSGGLCRVVAALSR